ncbi:MAG: nicotinate-nucleotide--dimethylbenzimidazole phosphoribosyltransferase [Pseudonocardiales bacterium]|nr:nicotinate-nucleotide--dimethylbenzimidazole phosphoribosyltransferase [Pseudonocardiales bacterium]
MITTILFGTTLVHAARPVDGAARSLRALAGRYRLGVVADAAVMTGTQVRDALAATGLTDLVEVIARSPDVGAAKPDPHGIRHALAQLGAEPGEALFVGDTTADDEAAQAAGVRFAYTQPDRDPGIAVRAALTLDVGAYAAAAALLAPIDPAAAAGARAHLERLTKPSGSLGRLEILGIQLAAISGVDPPPLPSPAAVAIFAADHGVVAEGVTPWPREVTAAMVANFVAGGAAINVLARQVGATVTVIDVGIATDLDAMGVIGAPALLRRAVRAGTANIAAGPAMSLAEARIARDIGAEIATTLVSAGARALVTGDMGIGNTTAAAAVIAALTGQAADTVTGRGTGVDDEGLRRKTDVVGAALRRLPSDADPLTVLSHVGGLEIAALAGFIVGAASHRVPVIVDGVVSGAALLAAHADRPDVLPYVIAGHRSTEPGATAVLDRLGLDPVLDLGMRLGEGTGGCLALNILDAAARILHDMATFEAARITPVNDAAS